MEDIGASIRSHASSFTPKEETKIMFDNSREDKELNQMHESGSEETEYEELDPRVQDELEKLNICTDKINEFELQLEEANAVFRTLLTDSTHQLKMSSSKVGAANIEKARPYYEALDVSNKAQKECQSAATNYQRASGIHAAAKETISLAEERFTEKKANAFSTSDQGSIKFVPPLNHEGRSEIDSVGLGPDQCPIMFDSAWQEMLNHATMKVMEAEALKTASEAEHAKRAAFFTKAEQEVQTLEKKLKKHIQKSRPYFEEKDAFNNTLESQKKRVQKLQEEVRASKLEYAKSLRALEDISESIHARRKLRMQYKMDVIKNKRDSSRQRDAIAEGQSDIIVDESELNYNLDEVDTYFRSSRSQRERQNYPGVSSISSSSCYGGSGSLDDLVSTEHDFSSTRSVSGKSESSLPPQSFNVESANDVHTSESTADIKIQNSSKSKHSTTEDGDSANDCTKDINIKQTLDTQ